jgi:NitT/TauT family transport system ATP-binding protein
MSPIELTSERGVILSNVAKTFGDEFAPIPVLRDCSFKIEDGQFTILIGPSGCGKTTLINLIAGYERPSSGRITCDGAEIRGPTRERLVLFQETSLFPCQCFRT